MHLPRPTSAATSFGTIRSGDARGAIVRSTRCGGSSRRLAPATLHLLPIGLTGGIMRQMTTGGSLSAIRYRDLGSRSATQSSSEEYRTPERWPATCGSAARSSSSRSEEEAPGLDTSASVTRRHPMQGFQRIDVPMSDVLIDLTCASPLVPTDIGVEFDDGPSGLAGTIAIWATKIAGDEADLEMQE